MANIILAAREDNVRLLVARIGHQNLLNVAMSFKHAFRYDRLPTLIKRRPKALRAWFTTAQSMIDEKGIQAEDIYMRHALQWALYPRRRWLRGQTSKVGIVTYSQEIANGKAD